MTLYQDMPYPAYLQNVVAEVLGGNLPGNFWVCFTIILLPLVKRVGEEKQTGVKVSSYSA